MSKRIPFSIAELRAVEARMQQLSAEARKKQITHSRNILLDHFDFMNLFKISRRTSQYWRARGKIPYSKIGGRIYFRLSDVQELIDAQQVGRKKKIVTTNPHTMETTNLYLDDVSQHVHKHTEYAGTDSQFVPQFTEDAEASSQLVQQSTEDAEGTTQLAQQRTEDSVKDSQQGSPGRGWETTYAAAGAESKKPEQHGDERGTDWNPKFSFFKEPVSNVYPLRSVDLPQVYELIKGETYAAVTRQLRALTDPKMRRRFKATRLAYVTFSGVFSRRSDKAILQESGLLALDFDALEDLPKVRRLLLEDPLIDTQLLFTSPSGTGLKWIIKSEPEEFSQAEYFTGVSNYLEHTYQLKPDPSGKDLSRACFLAHDPDIFIGAGEWERGREGEQEP